jgi:hypothetical protein
LGAQTASNPVFYFYAGFCTEKLWDIDGRDNLKEIDVTEHDLLVGDYRRRNRAFGSILDFVFVHTTQKRRQVMA